MERGSLKEYLSGKFAANGFDLLPLSFVMIDVLFRSIEDSIELANEAENSHWHSCRSVYGLLVGLLLRKAADDLVENQEAFFVKVIHMREKCTSVKMLKEAENNKATETRASQLPEAVCLLLFGYS